MAGETNYLIGRGELLTYDIKLDRGGGEKKQVYLFSDAKERLIPQLRTAARQFDSLPADACPHDYVVGKLALNPAYIAKSYFPITLLRTANLVSVGSRTIRITPERWARKSKVQECTTTEVFVAGKRETFRNLINLVSTFDEDSEEARGFSRIEQFKSYAPTERVKKHGPTDEQYFEVGLHLLPDEDSEFIRVSFMKYAKKLRARVFDDLEFFAGTIWFLPVKADRETVAELAKFAFVRVIRPVPRLRGIRPVAKRSSGATVTCSLPTDQPLSTEPRVAILDGGLPKSHILAPWIKNYRLSDPSAHDDPDGLMHGIGVSSAVLFGPVNPGAVAPRPYAPIDHVRVLDSKSNQDQSLELYRTLSSIEEVLLARQYEFLNLSLGPDLPIEDTDIHAWTSVIDDLLSDGDTFMTVAVGNNGNMDWLSNNARVQVPSDCVNAVAVGATDDTGHKWKRSSYSAIGPGRSPGVIKPDLMAFGGSPSSYFHTVSTDSSPTLTPNLGTSFAAPYLLRSAVGIRAILGQELRPLTLKALLVHAADQNGHHVREVGWGKIPEDITSIITCPPGVARIIYQGELKPGKYLRAPLPMPKGGISGRIRLKATFCYASPTDPQDASAYTKAGLDIVFRPNLKNFKKGAKTPKSKGFFDLNKYATETERRSDMGKWETTLHATRSFVGSKLENPVFDIHYNARDGAAPTANAEKIKYALVLTIEVKGNANLYNEILQAHSKTLVPIQPQVSVPIRT